MNTNWLRTLLRRGGVFGALVVAAFLLLHWLWRRKRGLFVLLVAAGFVAAFLHFRADPWLPPGRRALRVTFLDVGKGDAILIETPSGKVLVVDAGGPLPGGDDRGRRVVAPFLRRRGIERIDALLLTHPHPDHIGGAASLLERFPVGVLLDNGLGDGSALVRRYREAARRRGVPYRPLRRTGGEASLDLGAGMTVSARVLHPPAGPLPGKINNTSIVLRIAYGRTVFLLTGDAQTKAEEAMIEAAQPLGCTVLKVAHHGGEGATTARFLRRARPRIAVISVNADNRNGQPGPGVLRRLREAGARVYRTDRDGTVTCLSDGVRVRIATR